MEEISPILYEIELKCDNCNHIWKEQILKGYRLLISKGIARILNNEQSEESLEPIRILVCPNCMCTKDIRRK